MKRHLQNSFMLYIALAAEETQLRKNHGNSCNSGERGMREGGEGGEREGEGEREREGEGGEREERE